ncbi:MAG: DNA polymerase III subunit delta' [Calditrichaceae bacterium]|nr:DNA polymerase III subunit delta' [Calditrichaceae bacterium]MBN2708302.1 DNA polymerase III subunit delta' [Calditrichaceae bacterium]RQV91944.1 MAG: DNA polymerase III subunit delta' [Calditrichota bacterium]
MQYFRNAVVQHKVRDIFDTAINSNRLAHAYIFHGPPGSGKLAFALELARAIICSSKDVRPCYECPNCVRVGQLSHPDLRFIFPIPKDYETKKINKILKDIARNPYAPIEIEGHLNITVDTIRELINESKYAPHEASMRFYIITGADQFSKETSNAFLKLLEEPPETVLIILITDQYHKLLDTIKSRCQPVYFPAFSDDEIFEIVKKYTKENEQFDKKFPDIASLRMLLSMAQYNLHKVFEYLNKDQNEKIQWSYEFIQAITIFDMNKISNIIEKISGRKNKNLITELLNIMILWFSDALHFSILKNEQNIVLQTYKEKIIKFVKYAADVDYIRCIAHIEDACKNISANVQIPLQLTTLAINLNETITTTRNVLKEAV